MPGGPPRSLEWGESTQAAELPAPASPAPEVRAPSTPSLEKPGIWALTWCGGGLGTAPRGADDPETIASTIAPLQPLPRAQSPQQHQ